MLKGNMDAQHDMSKHKKYRDQISKRMSHD
jgi:hypothetical protein